MNKFVKYLSRFKTINLYFWNQRTKISKVGHGELDSVHYFSLNNLNLKCHNWKACLYQQYCLPRLWFHMVLSLLFSQWKLQYTLWFSMDLSVTQLMRTGFYFTVLSQIKGSSSLLISLGANHYIPLCLHSSVPDDKTEVDIPFFLICVTHNLRLKFCRTILLFHSSAFLQRNPHVEI